MTVIVRFGTPWLLRELSIDVVHEQLRSTICEQSISPVDDTMAEDLIVSCHSQWSEQLSCRWLVDESWCSDVTHVDERGTWQLCHVRRLAFPLNTSFYLMQHTPLWRSKFRILRIKKTRTKIGTLRISHTSLKLHRDIPSGSFTGSDLRKIGAITDKFWWLSRAYKCSPRRGFQGVCFYLYLYLAKLLSLNLYKILWSQFCVFAHSTTTLYWCQH